MICPKCNSMMEKVEYQSIEIDRCKNCSGLWFDMLEAEHLKEMKGSEQIDIGDPETGKMFNKIEKINCPKCNIQMAWIQVISA
jgi:Zn-finger nucleic acid-binding protein